MSDKSETAHLVRVKEHLPYFGRGTDELVVAIRKIFADNKYPQKIVLEAGVRHIYIEKMVPASEARESESLNQTIHDAIRNTKMEEYEGENGLPPMKQLFEMFAMVQEEGFEVCHIAVGDKSKFQKWLGFRIPQTNMNLLGTPITVTGEIPDDVFVICGGPSRSSDPFEVVYTVKGTL